MQEMLTKNTTHTLTVTGMTSEGLGVGRLGQMAVFVPHAAVGDTMEVLLTKVLKTYAYGKMIRLLTPSQTRILPDCEQFSLCGGCVYRHISYEEELRIKEELVKENFYKIGHMQIPFEPILPSPLIDGYRNKAQLPVGYTKQGALTCGFYQKRSHRIIPNTSCLLQPKAFGPIEQEILLHMKEYSIPPYDEETRKGIVRHIYLRRGESTGEIMVCIVVTGKTLRKSDILVSRLRALDKNIASIVLNHNPKNTNVILGEECTTLWGKDSIEDVLCGVNIQISPLSFYQVNRQGAQKLYQKAAQYAALTGSETVLDLYCGAGTIGLSMAKSAKRIIGVEIIPQAVQNAQENARINQIQNAQFFCEDASSAASRLAKEGIRPDVVVLDPPRKGLTPQLIGAVVQMAPARVVMVSCNSATAARDCAVFAQNGYVPRRACACDLFPRTAHVECVVVLEREEEKHHGR